MVVVKEKMTVMIPGQNLKKNHHLHQKKTKTKHKPQETQYVDDSDTEKTFTPPKRRKR